MSQLFLRQVLRPYILPDGYTLPLVPGGGREVRLKPYLKTTSAIPCVCTYDSHEGLLVHADAGGHPLPSPH